MSLSRSYGRHADPIIVNPRSSKVGEFRRDVRYRDHLKSSMPLRQYWDRYFLQCQEAGTAIAKLDQSDPYYTWREKQGGKGYVKHARELDFYNYPDYHKYRQFGYDKLLADRYFSDRDAFEHPMWRNQMDLRSKNQLRWGAHPMPKSRYDSAVSDSDDEI